MITKYNEFLNENNYSKYSKDELIDKLDLYNIDPNKSLVISSKLGILETVKDALKRNAYIHYKEDLAFRNAVYNNHTEIVEYLIKNGANITVDNYQTLTYAARIGNLEIVKLLIKNGIEADVNHSEAFITAVDENHYDIAAYLLDKCADPNDANDVALKYAVMNNNTEMVELIIRYGNYYSGDFNNINDYINIHNSEALKYAVSNKNLNMVKYLLRNGSNIPKYILNIKTSDEIKKLLRK